MRMIKLADNIKDTYPNCGSGRPRYGLLKEPLYINPDDIVAVTEVETTGHIFSFENDREENWTPCAKLTKIVVESFSRSIFTTESIDSFLQRAL